jgi:hypothetical protein
VITKRADELVSGDRVITPYGVRTVTEVRTAMDETVVDWQREAYSAPRRDYSHREEPYMVEAPSKLDLAVQRAQELADKYQHPNPPFNKDFDELLGLFRDAR